MCSSLIGSSPVSTRSISSKSRAASPLMERRTRSSANPPISSRRDCSTSSSSWKCRTTRSTFHSPARRAQLTTLSESAGDIVLGQLLARCREDLLRAVELDELAEPEEGRVVGHARRLLHVVRDDHDRIVLFQVVNQLLDPL